MKVNKFLYILDLGDNQHIKLGITNETWRVIFRTKQFYKIKLERSLIVESPIHRTIELLEKELKHIFGLQKTEIPKKRHKNNGRTEITKREFLPEIIRYIEMKQSFMNEISYKIGIGKKELIKNTNKMMQRRGPWIAHFKRDEIEDAIKSNKFSCTYHKFKSDNDKKDKTTVHKTGYLIQGDDFACEFLSLFKHIELGYINNNGKHIRTTIYFPIRERTLPFAVKHSGIIEIHSVVEKLEIVASSSNHQSKKVIEEFIHKLQNIETSLNKILNKKQINQHHIYNPKFEL